MFSYLAHSFGKNLQVGGTAADKQNFASTVSLSTYTFFKLCFLAFESIIRLSTNETFGWLRSIRSHNAREELSHFELN